MASRTDLNDLTEHFVELIRQASTDLPANAGPRGARLCCCGRTGGRPGERGPGSRQFHPGVPGHGHAHLLRLPSSRDEYAAGAGEIGGLVVESSHYFPVNVTLVC